MNLEQKTEYLKDKYPEEWLNTYRQVEDEKSKEQAMFCVCGKLATGLHEGSCRKFAKKIMVETTRRLNHLIEQLLSTGEVK